MSDKRSYAASMPRNSLPCSDTRVDAGAPFAEHSPSAPGRNTGVDRAKTGQFTLFKACFALPSECGALGVGG